MNYRHIYHAGNVCDVVKHTALCLMLEHFLKKDAPFFLLDTHAGTGVYDLKDERAAKTQEAQEGVLKLLDGKRIPELQTYYDALRKLNIGWAGESSEGFRYYPGSPLLALQLMRKTDRLVACELHPEDAEELKRQLFPFKNAHAHQRDGYEALGAFLPPAEKRGFVLIDPPFEAVNEFDRLAESLISATKRWEQGTFMVWYPIKERPAIWGFHEKFASGGIPNVLVAEYIYREEDRHDRLNGSGLLVINPPWQMDVKLKKLFQNLHEVLPPSFVGDQIKWLSKEAQA